MTTLRAIIYCRVSSKEQTLNLSLPVQEDQCRAFCKLNGWEVDHVFIERGESAKTSIAPSCRPPWRTCETRTNGV